MIREERNALLLLVAFTVAAGLLYFAVLRPALDDATRPVPVRKESATPKPVDPRPKSARRMVSLEARPVDAVTGRPLPDTEVRVTNIEDIAEPTAQMNSDGLLRIDHLPPDISFGVELDHDGYEPRRFSRLRGEARTSLSLGVVPLAPRRRVRVSVRDGDGAPVPRASIKLYARSAEPPARTPLERAARVVESRLSEPIEAAATDEDGVAKMRDLAPAPALVVVSTGDECAAAHEVDPFGGSIAEDVTLGPGVVFRGRLVGPGGAIAGARVVLVEARPGPGPGVSLAVVETDGDGRFTAPRIAPTPHFVFVDAEGVAAQGIGPYPVGTAEEVVIAAPDGAPLAGVVRDAARRPLADVEVVARADAPGALARTARTGPDGLFTVQGLAIGHATVDVSLAGFGPRRAVVPIPSYGGEFDVRLDRPGELIGVVTAAGQPLSGAVVRAPRAGVRAVCDVEGKYRLTGLPAGRVPLEVRAARHAPTRVEAEVRLRVESRLDLELRPGGELRVVVQGPDGHPRADATVSAHGLSADGRLSLLAWGSGTTDSAGVARLTNLPADASVVLFAHGDGVAPARSSPLEVMPEHGAAGVRLTLAAGGLVEGVVVDAEENPVANAAVVATAAPGTDDLGRLGFATRVTRSVEDGTFRLSQLPVGRYVFVARHGGTRAVSEPLTVREGARLGDVALSLAPVPAIAGLVRDASGHPLPDAVVTLLEPRETPVPTDDEAAGVDPAGGPEEPPSARITARARTDAAGRFLFAPDRNSRYVVAVEARGGRVERPVPTDGAPLELRFGEE